MSNFTDLMKKLRKLTQILSLQKSKEQPSGSLLCDFTFSIALRFIREIPDFHP